MLLNQSRELMSDFLLPRNSPIGYNPYVVNFTQACSYPNEIVCGLFWMHVVWSWWLHWAGDGMANGDGICGAVWVIPAQAKARNVSRTGIEWGAMADWGAYGNGCLGPCRLAGLALLFSVGILLQILVCFCSELYLWKKKLGPGLTCGSVLKLMHRRALTSEVMILGIHQLTLSSMLFRLGILNLICLQGLGCETGMRFV